MTVRQDSKDSIANELLSAQIPTSKANLSRVMDEENANMANVSVILVSREIIVM